ncbi:ATPase [Bacillota bacterium LX-D]|nr:ATPase [Bacillota bacterium LX-D]
MDVFETLDALEELIDSSHKIPLTNKIMVNVDDILDFLDQIRSVLPEEIRQSRWVTKEREKILAEAHQEAKIAIEEAKSHIGKLAEDTEVVRLAKVRAEEIINKAKAISQDIRSGAELYADELLSKLEANLEKSLEVVRQGRLELNHNKQPMAE